MDVQFSDIYNKYKVITRIEGCACSYNCKSILFFFNKRNSNFTNAVTRNNNNSYRLEEKCSTNHNIVPIKVCCAAG